MQLVDKNALVSYLYSIQDEPLNIAEEIAKFPEVEAEPVKHGKWQFKGDRIGNFKKFTCSKCENATIGRNVLPCYCSRCGAKMDNEQQTEV